MKEVPITANQWTGFNMIETSVMKELKSPKCWKANTVQKMKFSVQDFCIFCSM